MVRKLIMKEMKKLYFILIIGLVLTSCEDFNFEDQGFDLEPLPGYVAFANAGGTVVPLVVNKAENGGSASFRIECATGNMSNITVSFSFTGTAVFGTDFSAPNSTASGGTVILPANPGDVTDYNHVNLVITILTDGVADGNKTLDVELTGAVDSNGKQYDVGRGSYMKVATLNISDID